MKNFYQVRIFKTQVNLRLTVSVARLVKVESNRVPVDEGTELSRIL